MLPRKLKLIAGHTEGSHISVLIQTISSSEVCNSCSNIATPFYQIIWRWALCNLGHTQALKAWAIHNHSHGSRYFSRQKINSTEKMVMLKLPGCPWALSTVLRSSLPWEQHIHNWATRVDSNTDLIFQHGTYGTWFQCRKKKKHLLLLHIISLSLVHWGMQTLEFFAKTTKLQ